MIITLIGMSGAGKSHWSKQLAPLGFEHLGADDLIEEKLGAELTSLGYKGINDVSKWMGQPYEERYPRTSQTYLDLEAQSMREILASLDRTPGSNYVIDTTGSVIYLSVDILGELARRTTIVYFHTPESVHADMARLYLKDPKPVIWGDAFNHAPGESTRQALARCYPELLKDRTAKYQRWAHVTLGYDQLRSAGMTAQAIIDAAEGSRV